LAKRAPGSVPTDNLFTGQRLDDTGLYYYNARYYDALIGRFISADTVIPDPANPQDFNRYTYCANNPLKYVDPSGHNYDWYYMYLMSKASQKKSGQDVSDKAVSDVLDVVAEKSGGADGTDNGPGTAERDFIADTSQTPTEPVSLPIESNQTQENLVWSENRGKYVTPLNRTIEKGVIIWAGSLVIESAIPFEFGGGLLAREGQYVFATACELVGSAFTMWGTQIIVNEVQNKKFPNPVNTWNWLKDNLKEIFKEREYDPTKQMRI
jgi:RHS repeat-associated protein